MREIGQSGNTGRALEITAGIAGRRFGLCGFGAGETERISRALCDIASLAMPFDERFLEESAQVCDALIIKLSSLSPVGLRVAAGSRAPILVTGPGEALLLGAGAAYSWPRDFMCEPWTEAELVVRLFRLLQPPASVTAAARESRTEPLVIMADDDPEMLALVDVTLRNDGIACRTAENGLTALRLARELVPDLILLDVRMPKMDGFEVLATIRADPGIQMVPVILLTGCNDPADILRGSELHADDYLGKPVSPNILLNRVKRLLSRQDSTARRWDRALPASTASGRTSTRHWILNESPRHRAGLSPVGEVEQR